MQRDDFQYIWGNKYQVEVVQLSVGFVKNLLDPRIQKRWTIATIAGMSLVLNLKSETGKTHNQFNSIIGQNNFNYDLHHVCLALREIEPSTIISVIPSSDEKLISMTFGVLIKTVTGEMENKFTNIYASSILSSF